MSSFSMQSDQHTAEALGSLHPSSNLCSTTLFAVTWINELISKPVSSSHSTLTILNSMYHKETEVFRNQTTYPCSCSYNLMEPVWIQIWLCSLSSHFPHCLQWLRNPGCGWFHRALLFLGNKSLPSLTEEWNARPLNGTISSTSRLLPHKPEPFWRQLIQEYKLVSAVQRSWWRHGQHWDMQRHGIGSMSCAPWQRKMQHF